MSDSKQTQITAHPRRSVARRPFPKHTASKLSPTTRQPAPPAPFDSFSFQWDQLFAGDCQLSGGTAFVNSDGTATWEAFVSSSSGGGDVWLATFTFFDDHSVPLWHFGRLIRHKWMNRPTCIRG
jgi:hypothetical protein